MFESITKNFSSIIDKIRGKRFLSEKDIDTTIRDIRIALLEADVSLPVVREFVKNLKENIIGHEVIKNVAPDEMIIKLVNDELIKAFGEERGELELNNTPNILMMVGLQGSGKTTTAGKLAYRFKTKFNKNILLVSLDVYRPAAQEQLKTLAESINVDCLEIIKDQKPLEICKRALEIKDKYDIVIFDTAGRLFIDQDMMKELTEIKQLINPTEVILVADSLTGQEAVNIASEFDKQVGIDDIILTRIDGDGRGGSALSMREATGKSIRYVGVGEKIDALDLFHPKRIVSKILDKGDIVSFVEKAEEIINKEEAEKLENRIKNGKFDFNDLLNQIKTMKKFGGLGKILSFLPGASKIKEFMDEKGFDDSSVKKQESIIFSMTKKERENPEILNSSRKFRIARGSGTDIKDVNSLLKKFKNMKEMVQVVGNMDKNKMQDIMKRFGDIDNETFNK